MLFLLHVRLGSKLKLPRVSGGVKGRKQNTYSVLVAISRTNRVKHVTNMCDRRVDASATLSLALSPVPF